MSADNWGFCPICNKDHVKKVKQMDLKTGEVYGKVTSDEYLALLDEVAKIKEEEIAPTLREDYECFTDKEGFFYISYQCLCEKCGFKHNFKHEDDLIGGKK